MCETPLPRLVAETREIDPVDDLIAYTAARDPLAWLRRGEGIVGLGSPVFRTSVRAAEPRGGIAPLAERWRRVVAAAAVDDPVALPGTGLVAFGTMTFDARSAQSSVLTVPPLIVGTRDGRAWITRIRDAAAQQPDASEIANPEASPHPYGPYWSATLGPGALDPARYQAAVRAGLDAIAAGEVGKVVLARDLVGTIPAHADLRRLVRALAGDYLDTWTFAIDGLIGASPETLVTVSRRRVTARVLAGTAPRGADAPEDAAASDALAHSRKNVDEHRFAVRSVLDALAPYAHRIDADAAPFTLELPNLWHLATDVAGELSDHATALDLVAALHPTAAVAGTPTDAAIEVIRRLEPFDRARYAGPVGWVDAHGDGEWAIALRCAQIGATPSAGAKGVHPEAETRTVVAHAGAGIVAGSEPESELVETRVKFRPIIDALA